MPRNASLDGSGFRFYEWAEPGCEPVRLLSVTSIRRLAGVSHMLVEWQLGNVAKLALGIRKQTVIGPRGGVKEVYVKDGPFPGEFGRRLMATNGERGKLDELRRWLRSTADEPRDIAAVRGSVVHKLIELNVKLDRVTPEVIRSRMDDEWRKEKRKVKPDVTDQDVAFVFNAMRQYWHMREQMPFVILAQEPQVFNLTAGYGGSADVLIWFLGDWDEDGNFHPLLDHDGLPMGPGDVEHWQREASHGRVTVETIAEVGGTIALGDWKTSKGVYTDHVIQMHAYLGGEFIGSDGVRDHRLSAILEAMMEAVLIHIRPDRCVVDFTPYRAPVMRAFLGSVAFARFLAMHPKPDDLFSHSLAFSAPDTEPSHFEDDAE